MKLFTRKKLLLGSLFLTTIGYGQASLPLKVTNEVYNSNAFTYRDKTSWGEYELTSGDGWGVADIHFQDIPGTISLDFSRNKYGKSNSIQVLQSPDGVNWQENKIVNEGGSTSWKSIKSVLKKDTRYIRFYYKADYKFGDVWFKLAYWRNINIQKSVYHPAKQLKIKLKPNETADTSIVVKYSHPEGNLALSTNSADLNLKSTEITAANQEGESKLYFTCSNKATDESSHFIYTKDELLNGNADSTEVIILSDIELSKPVVAKPNSLDINWMALEGISDYRVEISHNGEVISNSVVKSTNLLLSEGLTPNTKYTIRIQPLADGVSYPFSDEFTVSTTPMPAFTGITKEFANNGFTARWNISDNENFTSSVYLRRTKTDEVVGSKEDITEQEFNVANLLAGAYYDLELRLHTPYEAPVLYEETFHTELPTPVLNPASDITDNGFKVTWNGQGDNIKYIFTLLKDGEPVADYNAIETSSPEITTLSLLHDQTYTYQVKSVSDEMIESPVAEGTAKTEMTVGIEKIENDGRIFRKGDMLFVHSKSDMANIKVYNLKGALIFSSEIHQTSTIRLDEKDIVIAVLTDGTEQITTKL